VGAFPTYNISDLKAFTFQTFADIEAEDGRRLVRVLHGQLSRYVKENTAPPSVKVGNGRRFHRTAFLGVAASGEVGQASEGNLLNRAVYGSAFRRHGKRLRVLPVLEKGEVRARALRSWERGTSGRWHIHCAIELPSHCDAVALERLIRNCWAKVEWGSGRILVRDGANAGWINYMLKNRQKSEFDGFLDCIIIESLHNPVADA